ncbi:MAG: hypothetical protein DRP62_04725 [Planctomycetota bacterium]|nr:MAG: hypothetical protein DRP62_04725 [Planctomycetota bacterium]
MKNKMITICAVIGLMMCLASSAVATTIATFADPSDDGDNPLFTVNMANKLLTGGWGDDKTGLTLVVYSSPASTFENAFFTATDVNITDTVDPWRGYKTEGGTIKFFADGADPNVEPLVQIDFDSGWVSLFGYGASNKFSADGVTISGSEIDISLTEEEFAFSFANHRPLSGSWSNGYTATAAFTSSALPEPATILLLGISSCFVLPRRKRGK